MKIYIISDIFNILKLMDIDMLIDSNMRNISEDILREVIADCEKRMALCVSYHLYFFKS